MPNTKIQTSKKEQVVITKDPPVNTEPYLKPNDAEVKAALNEVLGKKATVLRIGGLRKRC